jgi:membrane protease YdiL (CAAX protease family)
VLAGLGTGAALVVASRVWTARSAAGRALAAELGALVAGLTTRQALWLAALSGLAEEAFFRGALQPRVGWLAASLAFGLAHFHPRRELRVWSLSAALAGLAFGALFQASGDLLAPALAHATVNALNLRWLARSGTRFDPS